jgi:periplasmic protein TonB
MAAGKQTANPLHGALMRAVAGHNPQERIFWIGLACAAVIHALLILGAYRATPRQLGERDGSPDALNVDLIDEADFMGRNAAPSREDAAAPEPSPAREPATPQEAKASRSAREDKQIPDLFSLPDLAGMQSGADLSTKEMSGRRPQLDLSPPARSANALITSPDRGAALARPADITRSGENDEFGRGVVRALRKTMPSLRDTTGRVTVRLFLSETGNLTEVQLVRSSGDSQLDQSVVFAVKQASFPIPPNGSTRSDRTFLVTYIYN